MIKDLSGSWCIKATDESTLVMDSPVPLINHPSDLGSLILIQITPKKCTLSGVESKVLKVHLVLSPRGYSLQWLTFFRPQIYMYKREGIVQAARYTQGQGKRVVN